LFDCLKDSKIKCETINIFWFDDLTRALRKTLNKLSKYYAMIEEKRDTLYDIEILFDSTKKLIFYQINCFTNILANNSDEYFWRIFFTNIFHERFSRTFFTNISREHFTLTFSFLILTTSYKANIENSRMRHFIKINSSLILNAITRSNRWSTLERRMFWYKKNVLTRFLCKRRRKNNTFDNFTQFENNEINNYFVAFLIKRDEKTSNVIEYWKRQKTQYSLLVRMTKNVLAILCSNVEVERLFNLARNFIIYKRKRLIF
jgi:hypothetical protein